jgi:hypothetical protein
MCNEIDPKLHSRYRSKCPGAYHVAGRMSQPYCLCGRASFKYAMFPMDSSAPAVLHYSRDTVRQQMHITSPHTVVLIPSFRIYKLCFCCIPTLLQSTLRPHFSLVPPSSPFPICLSLSVPPLSLNPHSPPHTYRRSQAHIRPRRKHICSRGMVKGQKHPTHRT